MREFAIHLLSVNATWDFLCALGMFIMMVSGRGNWLAYSHFGMWLNIEDQDNRAAMLLFTVLVLNFGFLRLLSITWDIDALAALSYFIEGFLVFIALMLGWMERFVGWAMLALCAMCFASVTFWNV